MNKLKTSTAIILTLIGLCQGTQLIAGPQNPAPAPAPVPVVPIPAPVVPMPVPADHERIFRVNMNDNAVADLAQNLHDVKDITIIGNFGDDGLIDLSPNLPNNLTQLQLTNNHFGVQGVAALAENLPRLFELRLLQLFRDNIDDDGAITLAPNLPLSLSAFGFNDNNIGDAGLEALSNHINLMPNLKTLYLNNNHISNDGATYLADHLPNSLERLNLEQNQIGHDGLVALGQILAHHPNIFIVNLTGNQINDADKAAFNEALQGRLVEGIDGVWHRPQAG